MRQTESAIRTVRIIITVEHGTKDQAEKKCDDASQKSDEECFSSASAFAGTPCILAGDEFETQDGNNNVLSGQ